MKIVSWNINGIRAITGQNPSKRLDKIVHENKLFAYIENENPDLICVQETKADFDQINEDLRCPPSYHAFYHSCERKKGYSGVATFSKNEPLNVRTKFGNEEFDCEGRVLEADYGDFIHYNIYFPKGYTDHERLDYKLRFYDWIFSVINEQRDKGRKIIVSGDYNTAHKELDLAHPKENKDVSGFLTIEREKLDYIIQQGYHDSFREFCSEGNNYTWWSNRSNSRGKNIGWRIDYHFVTENLLKSLTSASIHPEAHGSDHCPIVLEFNL
ncbi:MAG: exodeoxyribonuclease III [Candidatus Kapabacteria bacterium]|nr:exodeoxyribonuclease III [Candidatus Kapabacteria bacterium]